MQYSITMEAQSRIFLYAVGFGFALGILYDVLRLLRELLASRKKAFLLFDLLYMLLAGLLSFLFLLTVTDGSIQLFVLLGELFGFFIYFVSLGTLLAACFDRFVFAARKFFKRIFSAVKGLALRIFQPIRRNFLKNAKKTEKKAQFSIRKLKFNLKNTGKLLYNLPNKFLIRQKSEKQQEGAGKKWRNPSGKRSR